MEAATILYYFAPGKKLTAPEVERDIGPIVSVVVVRAGQVFPFRLPVHRHSLVALDLDGIDLDTPPPVFGKAVPEHCLAIIPASQALPPTWLPLLRNPEMSVMVVPGQHPGVHPQAVAALRSRVFERRANLVHAVIARSHNVLDGMQDVVQAVLSDPFGIRSPRDLADALQTTVAGLESRCAQIRSTRPEHLLTLIRWLAVEHLVSECRLTISDAMRLVGMRDKSNFRRQWRRASYLVSPATGDSVTVAS